MNPLEEIGIEYHVNTERFDRLICSSYRHADKAIPVSQWEKQKCEENALHELSKAYSKASALFSYQSRDVVRQWISRTAHHPEVIKRLKELDVTTIEDRKEQ